MGRPGCGLRLRGSTEPPAATRCSCTWCWPGSIEPINVVFAALAESSLVEDRIGWSIRKIVRPAAGTAPSRSAPEPANALPKTQPLPTSTTRSRRSTRSVVRTNLSQVGSEIYPLVFPPVLPGPFVPLLHQPRTTRLARCPSWSGPEHARSQDFRIITHWPQRELIPVRVAGEHGGACSISDGPRVRGTHGQNAKYGLANGPAAVGTAADIEAGGTVGTGNDIPSVVRVGAEVEVLRRCAERFVAPVPDDEPGRDGAMLQSPRVAVCGRGDEGVTASSLKTAVAATAVRCAVDGAQPSAVALVVVRRAFGEETPGGGRIHRQFSFADAQPRRPVRRCRPGALLPRGSPNRNPISASRH